MTRKPSTATKNGKMTTRWLTGWLVVFFLVLVMVFAAVTLVADMLGDKIAATADDITADGRGLRASLSRNEHQLDQIGRSIEKVLQESHPEQIDVRVSELLENTTFDGNLPFAVMLELSLPNRNPIKKLYQDPEGDGGVVKADLAGDRAALIPAPAEGLLGRGGLVWGTSDTQEPPEGSIGSNAILYRVIQIDDISGYVALQFDSARIASLIASKMPIPGGYWILTDAAGQMLEASLPEKRSGAPAAKPLRNTGLAPDTLGAPAPVDDKDAVSDLIGTADALVGQIGFYRGRTLLNEEPVYVFPVELGNGWRFFAVYPSRILFADQIDIMRLFTGITVLSLALALLAGLLLAKRTSSELSRLAGAVGRLKRDRLEKVEKAEAPAMLEDPSLAGNGDLADLARNIRDAWSGLVRHNGTLEGELEKNRQLANEISRFYAHVRVLNGQDFRIDFFEYLVESDQFLFLTGLATLLGNGAQISREMEGREFFERFDCRMQVQDGLASVKPYPATAEIAANADLEGMTQNPEQAHDAFGKAVRESLAVNGAFSVEFSAIGNNGGRMWLRCWGQPDAAAGKVNGALLDISQEVRQRHADRNRLLTDTITGFFNRNALSEMGGSVLVDRDPGEIIGFVYFGLKNYQEFESRFGMVAGNAYIRVFADLLRENVPDNQVLFRWWGSDFLCIVRGMHEIAEIRMHGENLLQRISGARRSVNGISAEFPLIAGYSIAGVHGDTPSELLEYAAFAKHEVDINAEPNFNEFNRTRYDDSRQVALRRSFIRDVIERNELYVVYQPIVSLKTGDVFGFEALSRPANRIYRNIMELIDDAEDTGHYAILERRMVYNALDGFMERPDAYRDAWLFINTAPVPALTEADYLDIRDRYFGFMRVVYEVIERNRMDPDEIERRKNLVRQTGAKFALDDFGSGYSNHLALLALEPDVIKIDRGLVQNVDRDIRKQQMLEDIIGYARQGGTRVLAEGVETRGELAALCRMGVDYAQGFFLARPAVSFGGVATEAADLIRSMTRTGRTELSHAVSILGGTLALQDPELGRHALLTGWMLRRLASVWGMEREDACRFSLAGILQHLGLLLGEDGEEDWRVPDPRKAVIHARTAAGLIRGFLPEYAYAGAIRHQYDRDASATLESRLIFLAGKMALQTLTGGESIWAERFQRVLDGAAWPEGRRLSGCLAELAADYARGEWREEYLQNLQETPGEAGIVEGCLRLAACVVDARSHYLSGHAVEMEKAAEMLSHMMKIGWRLSERIRLAALLRDLGYLSVPLRLFDKTSRLSSDDLDVLRGHTEKTRDILMEAGIPDLAAMIAPLPDRNGSHQEGSMEKDLALGRGILATVDVLSALLQERAWRPAMNRVQTAAILTEMAGNGMLDVHVVDTVLENFDELSAGMQAVRRDAREKIRQAAIRLHVLNGQSVVESPIA